jgi:hypothetical protein
MMLMYISQIQKGLTVMHNEFSNLVSSPGSVDGIWGARTAEALYDFAGTRLFGGPWTLPADQIIIAGPSGAQTDLPDALVSVLNNAARRYVLYQPRSAEQVASTIATSQGQHGTPPSTADILAQSQTPQAQAASAISASVDASSLPALGGETGIGTAGKIVLGLLVVGGVVGVIYWARKGKRRR